VRRATATLPALALLCACGSAGDRPTKPALEIGAPEREDLDRPRALGYID
jgi:hypothetical protein